jgi:hypothetical protein
MSDLKYKFINILASVFSVLAFGLFTLKFHTTRETDNIGYTILFLILAGQILLFLNGILNTSVYIYIPAMIIICLILYIIYIKVSNEFK